MQFMCQFSGFLLRQVIGGSAVAVAGFLQKRFGDHSQPLPQALQRAAERAWQTLGVALAGDGVLDRAARLFTGGDDRSLREPIQAFLKSNLFDTDGDSETFRKACLTEWRQLRRAKKLLDNVHLNDVALQAARFERYTEMDSLVRGAEQAMIDVADVLAEDYPNLARLLRQPTPAGPTLLAAAFAYFFRQEVIKDDDLVHELLLDNLRHLTAAQGKALGEVNKALASLGDGLDDVLESLDEVRERVETSQAAILDLQTTLTRLGGRQDAGVTELRALIEKVLALLGQVGMHQGEVRPRHSFSIRGETEKRLVQKLLERYRLLPPEQQRELPALLNGLGKLQIGAGDFTGARQSFLEVAGVVNDNGARAEASYNAYRAALEEKRWSDALAAITHAGACDPARFALFPAQRYQAKQILGVGGFGTVFLCYDRNLGENVVVKTLHASEMDRHVLEVFREARLLRQLNHPAIIGARDGDFADPVHQSRPFIVMDYFAGSSLEARLEHAGPLSPRDAAMVALRIAEGMQAAHARGILHRDLKPDNILVRKDANVWEVKIIDFGLALRRPALEGCRDMPSPGYTVLGQSVAGTLRYAPPEQLGELRVNGKPVPIGPYSDVYAFGKLCCYALFKTTEPRQRHWNSSPQHAAWQTLLESCLEDEPKHRLADFEPITPFLRNQIDAPASAHPEPTPCEVAAAPSQEDLAERLDRVLAGVGEVHTQARRLLEEQHDYAGAAQALLTVPEHARDTALYRAACDKRDRVAVLEEEIRQAVQSARLHGLRSRIETLLKLQPGRPDLLRLLEKLPQGPRPREVVTCSHDMKFVWIGPGSFLMGSPPDEAGRSEDETQHRVTLTQGFWLGVHPVTQAEWLAVMGTRPSHFPGSDRPVEQVSWEECHQFCVRLGQLDGLRYRLPTEAEWEYACRAGSLQPFAFGSTLSTDVANYDGDFVYGGGNKGLYREQTTAMGFFPANRWGLHDMHGNVWEWCGDWHADYPRQVVKDPRGPAQGVSRIVRGGSWSCPPRYCRSAFRFWFAPGYRSRYLGCRVVVCLEE
jgi:formylglycine-generating enzyme required for sulfatase activity/predicted Ser/Thr protein kinase